MDNESTGSSSNSDSESDSNSNSESESESEDEESSDEKIDGVPMTDYERFKIRQKKRERVQQVTKEFK